MTIEQRVAVLEEIFSKLQNYYMSGYSGEEIDALLASAGVPIGITKEYDSVSAMNDDFSSVDVTRGQFVLILTTDTSSEDYGKVYLKGSANWVYVFTLTSLTAIKGPQGPAGKRGAKGADGADGKNFMVLGYYETLSALNAAVPRYPRGAMSETFKALLGHRAKRVTRATKETPVQLALKGQKGLSVARAISSAMTRRRHSPQPSRRRHGETSTLPPAGSGMANIERSKNGMIMTGLSLNLI